MGILSCLLRCVGHDVAADEMVNEMSSGESDGCIYAEGYVNCQLIQGSAEGSSRRRNCEGG